MLRIFWFQIAGVLLIVAATAGAQISTGSLPLVDNPDAFVAAEQSRLHQFDLLLIDAKKTIQKGDLVKAVPLLQQALRVNPDEVECLELLADIYIQWKRPDDVLQTLRPIFYPANNKVYSEVWDEGLRMKYVLALLDTGKWAEAAALYEALASKQGKPLRWAIPGFGMYFDLKEHTLPDAHFSPDLPDEPGLRTQAHLILGSRLPPLVDATVNQPKHLEYMLNHLQQAIKSDRRNLDAHFLSGVLLGKLERFAEARAEFAETAKLAPREAQPEIKAALNKLKEWEESKKLYAATHPEEASQARPDR